MAQRSFQNEDFDRTRPLSIFEYSRHLIGQSLHSLLGDEAVQHFRKGKGGLGQMVEELFFNYDVNSKREADFADAHVELKCTPLLQSNQGDTYRIKERLVCTMIDYFEIVNTSFEDSHLISKCQLMLLLFYLHVHGTPIYDYEFLFRILWQLPEKDLLLIKKDYETIAQKVRRGEAHLLSEGDTMYLGACRKGQKGDTPQSQPCSDIKANKRAFSLKPAYMRYVLSHVVASGSNYYTNYKEQAKPQFELVSEQELQTHSFEQIILSRFAPFIGKNYTEICSALEVQAYQAKNKYADVSALIASNRASKRLSTADEFIKSGIIVKTIRLRENGMPQESMSFKNIDYGEVYNNDNWLESEVYEIFTSRFLFVVFTPDGDKTIRVYNNETQTDEEEQSYTLASVFFWTMPPQDLEVAQAYWQNIRDAVLSNRITPDAFWRLSEAKKFHVRPKARIKADRAINPHGGLCDKYCYWFNAEYVKTIIANHSKNEQSTT
jgi:DNA mismatch repair protein MutH